VLNTSTDKITEHFNWDDSEKNQYIPLNTSLLPVGCLVGALFGGPLSKYGRKTAMI